MKQEQPTTERGRVQQKYDTARANLLLVIVLTVVNIVLYFAESSSMLLFSASIPYYAVIFGVELGIAGFGLGVAAVLIGLYFLCWLLSKKKSGWLVFALVLFVLDTLGMVGLYLLAEDFSGILDALIHVWVLYYLIVGISTGKKLKTMPDEPECDTSEEQTAVTENSTPLRRIDENEKCRVLLESQYGGHKVCYRRVKRTNQLVIDNYIYDETEMLVETAHALSANIDGHTYVVGFNDASRSYFKVDGELITKKIRWY